MRTIITLLLIAVSIPAYAFGLEDLTRPEVIAPILAVLLAISELLGAIDVIKPNGIIQGIVDAIASILRKISGK